MARKPLLSARSRRRIQTLKTAGKEFGVLAAARSTPVGLNEADDLLAKFLRNYANWLTRLSRECLKLASSTEAAARNVATILDLESLEQSFNLQYLLLQQKMQNENRAYTAVSNIMKTKHDTVKNSISNVR